MSEKLNKNPEIHETIPAAEHEKLRAHANAEKHHVKNNSREKAHQAREAIAHETEAQQNPLERLSVSEKASQAAPNLSVNRELKQITLRRELKNIQRKLPAPQKALSKVIHQPVVRATSEFAGKTVTRPSGLLGGGLVALIGTSTYLYLARHMGFEYNYGVFLALFVGGFIIGIGLEFLVNLATNPRRKLRD
jgi:hypothetical protein